MNWIEFAGYDICKRRILTLDGLPGLSQDATDMQRNIYYGSMLSFDNINMVCMKCFHCLLYIECLNTAEKALLDSMAIGISCYNISSYKSLIGTEFEDDEKNQEYGQKIITTLTFASDSHQSSTSEREWKWNLTSCWWNINYFNLCIWCSSE